MKGSTLKHIAKQVNQLIKGRNDVPIWDYIMIDGDLLIATNHRCSYLNEVPNMRFDDSISRYLIHWKTWKKNFKGIKANDDIRFHCESDGNHNVLSLWKNGSKVFSYKEYDCTVDDFPKLPLTDGNVDAVTLSASDVSTMKDALKVASNDELRPAMNGVFLDKPDRAVATDGHRLVFPPLEAKISRTTIIPPEAIKLIPDKHDCYLSYNDTNMLIVPAGTNERINCRVIYEIYPDWKAVVPKAEAMPTKVVFNRQEMLDAMPSLLAAANDANKRVDIDMNDDNESFTISAQDLDLGTECNMRLSCGYSVDQPAKKKAKDYEQTERGNPILPEHLVLDKKDKSRVVSVECRGISFNGGFLEDFLKLIKTDFVKLEMIAENRAALFNDCFMLLPVMRLDDDLS